MSDGGGGGASPAREGGREEWLRVYDRMVAILRKSHRDVEALLADRTRLEAVLKIQHEFWLHRDAVLRDRLDETRRVEDCLRLGDAAKLDLLLGDKDLEVRRHRIYIEHQDGDLEDFKRDAAALAEENNALKIKLREAESCAELSEPTTDHEHSGRDWRAATNVVGEVDITRLVRRQVKIIGSYGARARQDLPQIVKLAESGAFNLENAISRKCKFEEANSAYEDLNQGKIVGRAVVEIM